MVVRLGGFLALFCSLVLMTAAGGHAEAQPRYVPTDRPGPRLTVEGSAVREAMRCRASVDDAHRAPVLLVPGTGNTAEAQYGSSWQPALDERGIPWCSLTPPHRSLGDIQVTGEYVVKAIRIMHRRAGRRIAILGHSQGGMSMRWALRFWPGTRKMVADVIGLAADNHGSKWQIETNEKACETACPPVNFQQAVGSDFLRALNSRAETFESVSYTEIYTENDQIVHNTPPDCSSCLRTGKGKIVNVSIQSICPADTADHVQLASDLVAFRLALDALGHQGPARPSRIPRAICGRLGDRGANPLTIHADPDAPKDVSGLMPVICGRPCDTIGAPYVTAEPRLRGYVFDRRRASARPGR